MIAAALHAFIERHRGAAERVYAVVDSARDPQLAFAGIERFGLERWSLFPSNTAREMTAVAPYLIPVPFEARYPFATPGYFDLWAARLGTSAGILVATAADTRVVWDHLRGQFLVTDESGTEFFFRFYDPRVLRSILPTFTREQASLFFGPVRTVFVEGEGAREMLACRADPTGASIHREPLAPTPR